MYTNKTGAPICADAEGNIVPCDSPSVAVVAVGVGSQISAEDAKRFKGLPTGDDNAPAEADAASEQPPKEAEAEAKAEAAPPANKMEKGAATKEAGK